MLCTLYGRAISLCLLLAFVVATFIVFGGTAFAQSIASSAAIPPDTVVTVPWGDWLATILGDGAGILAVIIMGILTRFLPSTLKAYLTQQRTAQVEQLLERALGFAAQKMAVAVKGQVAQIDVHNQLVESALQYAVDHGPDKLVKWMGGAAGIEQKIIARIPTSPSVAAVTLTPAQAAP